MRLLRRQFVACVLLMLAVSACSQDGQRVRDADDALRMVNASRLLADIRGRVADAGAVCVMIETSDESGYEFRVYEDHSTHIVTIERVRVDQAGVLSVLDVAEDEWVVVESVPE